MHKVLVTGGYGFVGSRLIDLLSRRLDLEVTVLDNLLSGEQLRKNVRFIQADIRNGYIMDTIIPEYDTVIHLAAIVGEPACIINPAFSYDVNVTGTRNILRAMHKDQRLIFTSSSSIYGNRPNEIVTEDSIPVPINNYAKHKNQAEMDIYMSGINYIILRPVTAFGVTDRTRLDLLVNTLIYNALSFGKLEVFEPNVMRPIIHVTDFARVLMYALDGRMGNRTVYNIGDPLYRKTKLQLAHEIASLCGATVIEKDGESLDPRNYDVSFQKLKDTGFQFGHFRLSTAILEIKSAQYTIADNPDSFSTPYKVRQFLTKESYAL